MRVRPGRAHRGLGERHRSRHRARAALALAAAVWALLSITAVARSQEPPLTTGGPATVAGRTPTTTSGPTTTTTNDRPAGTTTMRPSPDRTSAPDVFPTGSEDATNSSPATTTRAAPATTTTPPVRPATAPVVTTAPLEPARVAGAVGVLAVAGLAVAGLARSLRRSDDGGPAAPPPAVTAPTGATPPPAAADVVVLMAVVGEALLDSGYDVDSVRSAVADVAQVNGMPAAEIITMPTAMFASTLADGRLETSAVATGRASMLLDQIDDLDEVVTRARRGELDPETARRGIEAIRARPPGFSRLQRVAGNVLAAAGLAVLLGGSWVDIGAAAVLGAVVGTLLLQQVPPRFRVLLVVGSAFVVAAGAFLLARTGWELTVLPSVIPPLVTLLPGALLTTGFVELATGQMISGAGRMAAGAMQLVLLALGITGAAALVGIPAIDLGTPPSPFGPLTPWVAVAVFGVGILVNQCARPRSFGWIFLVLYVAYGAQVVGGVFFGGVLSAFIGAAAMTPVAVFVARAPGGPPAIVSFLPAYWLLVPGALGLVGVTTLLDGDTSGVDTLVTMTMTMVAISLGVLAGLALVAWRRAAGGQERAGGTLLDLRS